MGSSPKTRPGSGRITRPAAADDTTITSDPFIVQQRYDYDAAGTLSLEYSREWEVNVSSLYDQTRSYPSIDDRLAVINRHIGISQVSNEDVPGRHQVYQENWYDALGRRVLVRARKASNCPIASHGKGALACASYVERTVWDGDQIILEKRTDGAAALSGGQLDLETSSGEPYGEVVSVHAAGIDQPVAVRKVGRTSVVPHANWMGDYEVGTTANGTATTSCNGASNCPVLLWAGSNQTVDGQLVSHPGIDTWWGSLITEKTDPTGYKYMRNRYYNPQTGQFTQIDPIGLAGGVNLYGYAGGDPINFSDPFGLCPKGERCRRFTFGHLSSIADGVKPGANLAPGAAVGESGNTGFSSGPHLHYEVGTVDADGNYTPDLRGGPETDGCPLTDCSAVSSRPAGQRTVTANGRTVTRQHNGTDIAVPTGTAVFAPKGGEVIRAGWQDKNDKKVGLGRRVTIDVVIPRPDKQ